MKKKAKVVKPESRYKHLIILGIIIILMFLLRTVFPYRNIFMGDNVIFSGNDAWYHIRLAENMIGNFPNPMFFDKYTGFPNGADIIIPPMMSWIIVASSYIVSFGKISVHTVQVVGAWTPPVLAALTMIPVYIIGRELHNKWTGVLAVAIAGFMPTAFLNRSMLGFTDHHVLEVTLLTTTVMFIMLAYRKKQLRYYMFAGVSLGMFHLCWQGAVFGLFLVWAWIVVQFLYDYWCGKDVKQLVIGSGLMLGISFCLHMPWVIRSAMPIYYSIIPLGALLTPLALELLSKFLNRKRLVLTLLIGGVTSGIVSYMLFPEFIGLMGYAISWNPATRTISETLPLLPNAAFYEYGINLVFFFGGLAVFIVRRKQPWIMSMFACFIFIAVTTQCRWDYYFNIVIALMSAYFFTTIGMYFIREVRKGVSLILCVAVLFLTFPPALDVARSPSLMNSDWYDALTVLRANTEEPFNTEDSYYQVELEEDPIYGVMSWWDYGHWITQISHRVPVGNPFQQGAVTAAEFFVDGIELEGIKYVMIDTAMYTGKYYAMLTFLNRDATGVRQAPDDSYIMRMVRGELENYELVYKNNSVMIFEKV